MKKQELIDLVESFRYRVKIVACYRRLYSEYCENFNTLSDGINMTPAFWFVHIGFSQQQPKQQQRVPALQRAGRLSVCG